MHLDYSYFFLRKVVMLYSTFKFILNPIDGIYNLMNGQTVNETINASVGQLVECVQPYLNSAQDNYLRLNFTGYKSEYEIMQEVLNMSPEEKEEIMKALFGDNQNMILEIVK